MKRRELLKGIAALPFFTQFLMGKTNNTTSAVDKLIKPKRLSKGDTIGIIAPAGPIEKESLDKALARFAEFGFKAKLGKYILEDNGIYAGTDKQRLEDLHAAFSDPEIKAVWCIRGSCLWWISNSSAKTPKFSLVIPMSPRSTSLSNKIRGL
jgi:muramoyltetrapeptide carboxypeptidase